jgi:hypothetical protein
MYAGMLQLLLLAAPFVIIGVIFAMSTVLIAGGWNDIGGMPMANFLGFDLFLVVAWVGWVPSLIGWLWSVGWAYKCLKQAKQTPEISRVANLQPPQQPLLYRVDAPWTAPGASAAPSTTAP